jgi:hypothetical protein
MRRHQHREFNDREDEKQKHGQDQNQFHRQDCSLSVGFSGVDPLHDFCSHKTSTEVPRQKNDMVSFCGFGRSIIAA